jgi:hypothetical protein
MAQQPPFDAERLDISLEGRPDEKISVPADILAQVLAGMQRTIYLFAMYQERREVKDRACIPGDIAQRYQIRCALPEEGSYRVPATIGDPSATLFDGEEIHAVTELAGKFLAAVAAGDSRRASELIANESTRRRIVASLRETMPKGSSGLRLRLTLQGTGPITFSQNSMATLSALIRSSERDALVQTLNGRLQKIDFAERTLTLLYAPTQRELVCSYDEAVESLLLEKPRDLIQVTGMVVLDEYDEPKKISHVEDIRDVDLSPIDLSEVHTDTYILRFRTPIRLLPHLDESEQLICVEYPELGIDCYVQNRDELDAMLISEVDVLWRTYARGNDSRMTKGAVELGIRLRDAIKEEAFDATR